MELFLACPGISLAESIAFAKEHKTGVEVKSFTSQMLFHSDWHGLLDMILKQLSTFDGPRTMHGLFYTDRINWDRFTVHRIKEDYLKCISIAKDLQAETMVVHSTYMPGLTAWKYKDWLGCQVNLLGTLAAEAQKNDIVVVIENIVDHNPSSILDVINEVKAPNLKICLDFGHYNLIPTEIEILDWIDQIQEHLHYIHAHNNNGRYDSHNSLDNGSLDFEEILKRLMQLENVPKVAIETYSLDCARKSVDFIRNITSQQISIS